MQAQATLEQSARSAMKQRLVIRFWNPERQGYDILRSPQLDELPVNGSAREAARSFFGGFLPLATSDLHPQAIFSLDGVEYHPLTVELNSGYLAVLESQGFRFEQPDKRLCDKLRQAQFVQAI